MKKTKIILCAIMLSVLLAALYFISGKHKNEYSETRFLFDTECTIRAGGENAERAVKAAFKRADELDALFDYYSDSSAVSEINRAPANAEIPLGSDTSEILLLSKQISEASGGAFDITIAPVKELWRFKDEHPSVPDTSLIRQALESVNYNRFTLNSSGTKAVKLTDGIKIDLGGIAKGYAADAAAEALKENGAEYALIDFGGNVAVFGRNPRNGAGKWKIGIQKPFAPTGEYGETLEVENCAVVTSGIYERNFIADGILYHHILNPETGFPAENGLCSVTIVHPSSAAADALSTACFVLGEERGRELAESFGAEIYFQYSENNTEEQK